MWHNGAMLSAVIDSFRKRKSINFDSLEMERCFFFWCRWCRNCNIPLLNGQCSICNEEGTKKTYVKIKIPQVSKDFKKIFILKNRFGLMNSN